MLAGLAVSVAISFSILVPVVPVLVERRGPHGSAGAATAVLFVGAVAGELITPWLMSRLGSSRLLVAGQILTALPSVVYVFPHPPLPAMLAATGLRGLGMGVAMVVTVSFLTELTPAAQRGRAIGYLGLALSAPGIIFPSIGVTLLEAGHADVAALIALLSPLAGALVALRLPRSSAAKPTLATNLFVVARRPGLIAVLVGFVLVSTSLGGVYTYAPIALPAIGLGSAAAFLLFSGVARAASRWMAGILCDHQPARLVLIGGIVLTLAGLVALSLHGGPTVVVVAATAYGTGYGAVQTATYLVIAERGTNSHFSAISAFWNSGIDLGSSLGGMLIGLSAAFYGYTTAVWILPAATLISLPLFCWPARTVSVSPADIKGGAQ